MSVTKKNELAASILAGLTITTPTTAEEVTGGKHDANSCGGDSGCLGQGG